MRCKPGPERDERLRAALDEAAAAPLAIAGCAAELAELGLIALSSGSEHLRGDVVTGVLLAEAACASAVRLVELDLATSPDDPRHAEARRSAEVAAAARRQALSGSHKSV
jgi:formiminotetrahydrofolate cyclodeaminase